MGLVNLLTNLSTFYSDNPFAQKYTGGNASSTPPYAIAKGSFDQKSLRFNVGTASDRPGGGHSGQPFVIPTAAESFNLPIEDLGNTGGSDMFVRGGSLLAKHIKDDKIRIESFLKSPKGLLWIAQQEGLEKISPVKLPNDITPLPIYNPATTLLQVAGNAEGLHFNRNGVNPVGNSQTSYFALTSPSRNPDTDNYSISSKNRLSILQKSKIANVDLRNPETGQINENEYSRKAVKGFDVGNTNEFIIGNRRRVTNTSKDTFTFDQEMQLSSYFSTLTSNQINNQLVIGSSGRTSLNNILDFREEVAEKNSISGITFKSFLTKTNYQEFNLEKTYGVTSNDLGIKDVTNITGSNSTDRVTSYPIYTRDVVNEEIADSDLIPFYFQVVDNDNPSSYDFVHFRAYLGDINDQYQGQWASHTYAGRGENFYTYTSFTRGLSFSFAVAVESYGDKKVAYEKLNYLASTLAPDYSEIGYMRGNFVKLTIGDYLSEVPGIITSLTYNLANNIPWDIGRNIDGTRNPDIMRTPQVITVNVSFNPVHNFVPRKSRAWTSESTEQGVTKVTAPFISLGSSNQGYITNLNSPTDE
jgi:hypothetical protein